MSRWHRLQLWWRNLAEASKVAIVVAAIGAISVIAAGLVQSDTVIVQITESTAIPTMGTTEPSLEAAPSVSPPTQATMSVTQPASLTSTSAPTSHPPVSADTLTTTAVRDWVQVQSFAAPGSLPTGIVRLGDTLWVMVPSRNRFYGLDLQGGQVNEFEVPKPSYGAISVGGLTADDRSLWGMWGNTVIQIDPNSGQTLSEFGADLQGVSIAWDGSSLWVADKVGNLSVYDLSGNRLRGSAIPVFGVVSAITWVNDQLWMLNEFGEITRFDVDFRELSSFSIADACGVSSFHRQMPFGMDWDGGTLWVADPIENRIYQCAPGG